MRLHSLSVSAFLAFPGTEHVDFDHLGEAGLFLLQGRTGAGKTALLDAVCFAFYGEVPGARQESARLRSDHATPDTVTEVVLEATLRGRRIRITRAPEQERPKVRGDGTTTAHHRVQVVALDAGGERVLATRHDEARAELGDLLGMTKEQFCQVVLLPQGGFAKFLQARSDQREDLLRELFEVSRFAYVEHWLQDRRKSARAGLDDALQRIRDVVSQAKQAAGAEPPEDASDAAGWLDEQLVVAEAQATTAGGAFTAAGQRRAAAAAALVAARELAARQAELASARAALAEWESQRPERDAAEARLSAARRAAPAHAHATEVDARRLALDEAMAAAEVALAAAEAAGIAAGQQALPGFDDLAGEGAARAAKPLGALTGDLGRMRERTEAMRAADGEFRSVAGAAKAMLPREAALDAAIRALDQLRARAAGHAEAVATHEAALATMAERRPELEAAVAAGRDAAARLPGTEAAARAAAAAAEAGTERDALLAVLHDRDPYQGPNSWGMRTAAMHARERAVTALEHHAQLLGRRLEGIAAELAGRLADGEPCAVCGGTDHPSPAHPPDGGLVTEAEVRTAREAADTAVAGRDAKAAELAETEQRLAAARARAAQTFGGVEQTCREPGAAQTFQGVEGLCRAAADGSPLRPQPAAALTSAVPASAAPAAASERGAQTADVPSTGSPDARSERGVPAEEPAAALTSAVPAPATPAAAIERGVPDADVPSTGSPDARTEPNAQTADDPPVERLQAQAGSTAEAAKNAKHQADQLPESERALQTLDRTKQETDSRLAAAREAATQAQAQIAERDSHLQHEQRAVDGARAGHPTIAARIERLHAAADLAGAAADALEAATRAADEHQHATARALAAARKAGFEDLAALRAALLDDDAIQRHQDAVRAYDEQLTARKAAAARDDLLRAAEQPPPDVDQAEAAQAQAIAAADQAHSTLNEASRRHEALSALRTELQQAVTAAGPITERHAVLHELAELASGRSDANRLKMRLSAYVLAARLEEVAAAATVRLAQMSGGRYALEHADDGARGRSRGGLDLRVIDSWTGRDRPPSSLSGGETFLASLALALGLADVVTAEAGGAALETLFVDEGFGSLDDEGTLDEVLDVLDGLRDGGRAVGIVSHVPELRQRIPMQLRVEKGRTGSHVVA